MRQSILTAGFLILALAACSREKTLTYSVETDTVDVTKNAALHAALERVIVRRFAASGIEGAVSRVVPSSEGPALLTLTVPDTASEEEAERILSESFSFDILLEKPGAVAEDTEWLVTGVDGSSLLWAQALISPAGDVGVELQFDDAGLVLLEKTFKGNTGKNVGIFVRDLLVSKMNISSEEVGKHIVIGGIPSAKIAEVFSDDLNVGLHTRLHPENET